MGEVDTQLGMLDIVYWLAGVEEKAATFYTQASVVFTADKEFSGFLSLLAEEEAEHVKILSDAAGCMGQNSIVVARFTVDETMQSGVEAPFDRAQVLLEKGTLTKEAIVAVIAEAEFSEWNEIFLYVVDTLKGQGKSFQKAVAKIDRHRTAIETFISAFPGGDRILANIGRLRPVWQRRILVVEDDPAIAALIKCLVMAESEVVLARDGQQGLDCIREGHFNVVVSDVEMPNINGIELYKQALQIDPSLKKHFVFFSGTRKPEHHQFFQSENLVLLQKPSSLSSLRSAIYAVADAAD